MRLLAHLHQEPVYPYLYRTGAGETSKRLTKQILLLRWSVEVKTLVSSKSIVLE
jgi:hypothetical protein